MNRDQAQYLAHRLAERATRMAEADCTDSRDRLSYRIGVLQSTIELILRGEDPERLAGIEVAK